MPRIAVVDYCKGNLKSVERGIDAVGGNAFIAADPAQIAHADAIVLPGVGAFADAAGSMNAAGQTEVIREAIAQGVPFLGICLGLHLLFEEGTEGAPDEDDEVSSNNAHGLAVLPGVVSRMPQADAQGTPYKVPHVGWNTIDETVDSPLFQGISSGEYFYFTHSYCAPDTPCTTATTTHSMTFPSAVQYKQTCFGVQFHPEKSSDAGLRVMRNFCDIVNSASSL